jgi:hypothetical protein
VIALCGLEHPTIGVYGVALWLIAVARRSDVNRHEARKAIMAAERVPIGYTILTLMV